MLYRKVTAVEATGPVVPNIRNDQHRLALEARASIVRCERSSPSLADERVWLRFQREQAVNTPCPDKKTRTSSFMLVLPIVLPRMTEK